MEKYLQALDTETNTSGKEPMPARVRPPRILILIILAQFLGTASWFAGNAILPSLTLIWDLPVSSLAQVTNAVQLGFIGGALMFALLSLSDRFRPSRLFFICALLSAVTNVITAIWVDTLTGLTLLRFIAGFLLAGIYPVGMKLAATWFPEGLGRALGYLVGSLALGTAAPHLFASFHSADWQLVMLIVAGINLVAGLIILWGVGEGPNQLKPAPVHLKQIRALLSYPKLRASAAGYFGHMWEVYAIWAIAPLWIASWAREQQFDLNVSLGSFAIIGVGALGCAIGGLCSQRVGSAKVASIMLALSGICCLLSPLAYTLGSSAVAIFWAVWGFTVVADSPQFSALSAQNAPPEAVGTALTLINAIGFTLTLIAIQLSVSLIETIPIEWIPLILLPGPIIGVLAMRPLLSHQN